jgi:hypothetical protein
MGHKVNSSLSYSIKAMNGWSCTSNPAICLHGVDSENFNFTLHKVFIKSAVFKSILHCIHVAITDGCCSECDSYIRFVITWYIYVKSLGEIMALQCTVSIKAVLPDVNL